MLHCYQLSLSYSRAVVQSKQEDLYEVQFVDFGNSQAGVSNSEMILLSKELAEVSFICWLWIFIKFNSCMYYVMFSVLGPLFSSGSVIKGCD